MCCPENLLCYLCIAVASFAVLAQPAVTQGANITLPLTYPGQIMQGDGSQTCPSEVQRRITQNEVKNATRRLLQESVVPLLQLQAFSCGGSTGWRRVAYLNMSNSSQCPPAWREITTPHRVCGRRSSAGSCEGVTYSIGGQQYDQVCGRITGYQIGSPDSFSSSSLTINDVYVDGISVTHGSPRQHIWTFAAGLDEQQGIYGGSHCPCVTGSTSQNNIPSFVGQNYFCETGLTQWNRVQGVFWPNGDPLWDGQGCGPTSSCCTFNSPPWFKVQLLAPTTNDIEVRICGGTGTEDVPIQLIELYTR